MRRPDGVDIKAACLGTVGTCSVGAAGAYPTKILCELAASCEGR